MNKIDTVELVRKIRDKHYEETRTMNHILKRYVKCSAQEGERVK